MRGKAEVPIMKGFMGDFTVKGGESPETLPPEKGHDVTDEEKLQDKANGKEAPKGAKKTNEDDITMDPELQMVEDGAKKDIEDSYVSDAQGDKVSESKGFQAYNELVSKGAPFSVEVNSASDFKGLMADIRDAADVTVKELSGDVVIKAKKKDPVPGFEAHVAGVRQALDPKPDPVPGYDSHVAGVRQALDPKPKVGRFDRLKNAASDIGGKIKNTASTVGGKINALPRSAKIAAGVVGAAGLGAGAYALGRKKEEKGFVNSDGKDTWDNEGIPVPSGPNKSYTKRDIRKYGNWVARDVKTAQRDEAKSKTKGFGEEGE